MPKAQISTDVAVLDKAAVSPPVLLVALGPQKSGKSTLLRAILYRSRAAGRAPLICDGDRHAAYLTAKFARQGPGDTIHGVSRPAIADDTTVIEWLDNTISDMDRDQRSVALDMGGGDLVLPTYARDRELVDMAKGAGIRLVALHMILPSPDDLTVLEQMEEGGLFAPDATILALNAGPVSDTRPPDVVFRHVRTARPYRQALERGAREILVPTLTCIGDIDQRGLTFSEAAANPSPLGLTKGQMTRTFLRKLDEQLNSVGDLLP